MRVSSLVFSRFGTSDIYAEPFAGSLAVLLGKTGEPHRKEVVNDIDCLVANAWRGMKYMPDETAEFATHPTIQVDLEARRRFLSREAARLDVEKLLDDPEWCDPRIAGYWVWCASNAISMNQELGSHYQNSGINMGSSPSITHTPGSGHGVQLTKRSSAYIVEHMRLIASRLRKTHILCSNWETCVSDTKLGQVGHKYSTASVFLDPPYNTKTRRKGLYARDSFDVANDVMEWCIEHGDNPNLRIALCGLRDDYDMPDSWEVVEWTHDYNVMGGKTKPSDRGEHKRIETIWFSPHCVAPSNQMSMFG